jgi:N utilization substance protein B
MRKRRAARELALRTLFQIDLARLDPEEALAAALAEDTLADDARSFARDLVMGAVSKQQHVDTVIAKHARGWTLERMANIDRNILRLAVFEVLYLPDIPPSVTVDEAVELAKKYSTAESGRFVNGILGNLLRNLDTEVREAESA